MGPRSPAYAHSWQKCAEVGIAVSRSLRYGSHLAVEDSETKQSVSGIILGFISPKTFTSPGECHRDLVEAYAPRRTTMMSKKEILPGWSCIVVSDDFVSHIVDLDGSPMYIEECDNKALRNLAENHHVCFPRTKGKFLREGDRVASVFEVQGTPKLYFGMVVFSLNRCSPDGLHYCSGTFQGVVIAFNDGDRRYFASEEMHLLFRLKPETDSIHVLTAEGSRAAGWMQNNICITTSDFVDESSVHDFP